MTTGGRNNTNVTRKQIKEVLASVGITQDFVYRKDGEIEISLPNEVRMALPSDIAAQIAKKLDALPGIEYGYDGVRRGDVLYIREDYSTLKQRAMTNTFHAVQRVANVLGHDLKSIDTQEKADALVSELKAALDAYLKVREG